MASTPLDRVKQLAKGTRAAAAALPAEAEEVARRATEVAEAWSLALGGLETVEDAPSGLQPLLDPAVQMLESLHFELLQIGVLEREPDASAIENAASELSRLAEQAARLSGGTPPSD